MPTQSPITQSELSGRIMAFDIAKNYVDKSQHEAFEKDVKFYTDVPVKDEKPPAVLDLEVARSQTAQLRELRKEQEQVLLNEQEIVKAVTLTKETIDKIYPKC